MTAAMTAATVTPYEARSLQGGSGADAKLPSGAAERAVTQQLAFLAGVGVLAAFEILEWPVAPVLAVGHQLAHSHHDRGLREFGEALEEA